MSSLMTHDRLKDLPAAEREQLPGQGCRALAGALDFEQVGAPRRIGRQLLGEQLGEPEDRRQHVVEVVRDAAREVTDRLELLCLAQLLLQLALLGDVMSDHQDQTLAGDVDLAA